MMILERTTFTKDINYLINTTISEYDISKANINILYKEGVLNDYDYNRLLKADRNDRQKEIGIMILKNSNIYNIINNGIKEMRIAFMNANDLTDDNILSVKNDALFIIGALPSITKFDNIEFKLKNVYSSFYKANNLELYYYLDKHTDKDLLDIKGISDNNIKKHDKYFLNFLKSLFYTIEVDINDAVTMLRSFYDMYMSFRLDINYYRSFDAISMFKVLIGNKYYDVDMVDSYSYLDINCNLNLIRDLWQIITHIQWSM